jgi:hypothetical protein
MHSWWVYEFAAVSVAWSLLVVERAFRVRLEASDRVNFQDLIKRAQTQGLVSEQQADRLDAGRQLRKQVRASGRPIRLHVRKGIADSRGVARRRR